MKLYIGTLHTIENEFNACLSAIQRQTHSNFEHFIFSGLNNTEAHAALYEDFLKKQNEFDLLIKVDADMVLANDRLFEAIEERFSKGDLARLTIAVHDWFSNRLISGLNAYSAYSFKWVGKDTGAFMDKVISHDGKSEIDWDSLAPAAYHCPNPSPFQAFHFGMHKAMKVIQPYENYRVRWRMREHWENLERTEENLNHLGDRRLALAILASEIVYSGRFRPEHLTYSHPFLKEVFADYENMEMFDILEEIKELRRRNWGGLPVHVRKAFLWYKFRSKPLSLHALKSFAVDCIRPR